MQTKFTAAPWRNYKGEAFTAKGLSIEICQLDKHSDIPASERRANAKLIKSAPDMHKALSMIISKLYFNRGADFILAEIIK